MRKFYFNLLMCSFAIFFAQSLMTPLHGQLALTTQQQLEAEKALMQQGNLNVNFDDPIGSDGILDGECDNALPIESGSIVDQPLVCGTENLLTSATVATYCNVDANTGDTINNSYGNGLEATYTYTPSEDGTATITVSNTTWTAIFVYEGCPVTGTCVAATRSTGSSRTLTFAVTGGVDYFFWIDSWPSPASPCVEGGLLSFTGPEPETGNPEPEYCDVQGGSSNDATGLTNVTFADINNNSSTSGTVFYEDFTAISTEVTPGESYDLSARVNTAGNWTVQTRAWIDWNLDGTFDTATEEYNLGSAVNVTDGATSLSPVSVMVPADAAEGTYRLRVRAVFGTTVVPHPCNPQSWSEAEDYTIIVAGGGGSSEPLELCNDTDVAITDNATFTSVINVPNAGTIGTDATLDSVVMDIQHTFAGDLEIVLVSPAGTEVALTTDNGSLNGLDTQAILTFMDSSTNMVTGWDGTPTLANYKAEGGATAHPVASGDGPGVNLNDEFAGESITGDWTLRIYDDAGGDIGTLFNYCLNFTVPVSGGDTCEWTVTVSGSCGDEVTWELRDVGGAVVLSGGPYTCAAYTDTQSVSAEGPVEFYIESMGTWNDNTPAFTIENENGIILTGGIDGGTEGTYSDLNCSDLPPPAPANDDCSGVTPTTLTNGTPVTFNGTTEGGTASAEEMAVLGYGAVWEAVTLTGDCNDLTIDYCGTPAGNMDGNFFIVYTPDCPATSYVIGAFDWGTCGDGNGTLRFTGLPAGTYYLPVILDPANNNMGAYVMNVISEDCFVPEPPDYPCYQGDGLASNGFENGYNVTAGGQFRNADDFVVDNNFNLQYIRLNLFMNPGATATSVTFNIRADEGGIPSESTIAHVITDAIPTSQVVIGSNFGYNISQVEFVLDTPIDITAGTYWLQPEVTTSDGIVAFWEVSTTGTLGGFMHTSDSSTGGAWTPNDGDQGVFFVAGVCNEAPEGCLTAGFGQYPSTTFIPTCSGAPEVITTLGWAGEYSMVTVTAGETYVFSSSIATDFITISDEAGTVAYAVGTGSVTWTATANENVRFYTHLDDMCTEDDTTFRSRIVQCGDIPPPPANDDCEDAIAVACGDNLTGSTLGALDSGGNPAGDVFYTFTGTGDPQLVTVSLCGSSYDTYLRVFTDCTLSTEIAFNDDFCDLQSELTFTSDGTSTYVIMVEGFSSNVGDFVMDIQCAVPPPPPAECEDHEVLDNGMENAYFFANRLAVDIPVGDTGFTVEGLYITIAVPEGTEASSFNFIFFDDNSGIPGSEVGSATGSIIGSEVIGQNFGRDFIQYNVDFDAGVSLNANTNYWMEVQSDAEAWDWTSEMTSIIGQTGVLDNGSGWASADGGEFVYALYCEEMGVGEMNDFEFAYYPNPVKDYLNIESQKAIESIDAFNLAGQKVISNAVLSEGKINLNNLSAGTYVFRVKLEGGQVETFKVVKK